MDPLSFTASLLAVIGGATAGAKAGKQTLRKVAAYRHAPEEIGKLSAELERFERLLEQTLTLVESIDDVVLQVRGQCLKEEVEKASMSIAKINDLVSASPNAFVAKLKDERQVKAIWMKNKKEIMAIHKDLESAWRTIHYALDVLTASSAQAMRQAVNMCVTLGETNSERLAQLTESMMALEKKTLPFGDSTDRKDVKSEDDIAPSEVATAKKSLPNGSKHISAPSWRISSIASQKCRIWCSCSCHSRKRFMTPFMLTSVLGHFVVEISSTGPKCNERSCLRSDATYVNLNYNFPRYLSSQHVSLTMDYTPIYGANFKLRMPRVTDWEHLLWGYANNGNMVAIQKMFSERKASPLDVNLLGETALNYAARHPKLYRFLVENGGDQELTDVHGYKPTELIGERLLSAELSNEDTHVIGNMLDETDFMETRRFTIIHKIVLEIVKRSLEEELEISTALIDSTDSKGRTPLAWATIRDDLPKVTVLLDYGADPNIQDDAGDSCLHFVRSVEVCSALLQAKADVNKVNKTFQASCLQTVCKRFDAPEVIELLHDAGGDIDHRDADAETPLLNAIFKKHTKTARRLIELGANVNAANHSSQDAAIHFAVSFDHYEILPVLLQYGVDYTAKGPTGRTFAHMTAQFSGPQTMRMLATLKFDKLDPGEKDARGKTAAEYMGERDFFPESEPETRAAFEIFQQSLCECKPDSEEILSNPCLVDSDGIRLPGAFPKDNLLSKTTTDAKA